MSLIEANRRNRLNALLELLVCDEFELMEACHEAAADASGESRARFLLQAGLCQAHLFDLDSSLRELEGRPASYSSCVRRTLGLGRRSFTRALNKLIGRYQRALAQRLPEALRELYELNELAHRRLAEAGRLVFGEMQKEAQALS